MHTLPCDILFLSQLFGIFPLKFTHEKHVEFSSKLSYWSLIFITLLVLGACLTFPMDIAGFLTGNWRSHVGNVIGFTAACLGNIPSIIMAITVLIASRNNYKFYIEMSCILKEVDKKLKLNIQNVKVNLKIFLVYIYLSLVLGNAFQNDFHGVLFIMCSNAYKRCVFLLQITLCLHFNFVCQKLSERIKTINIKIEEEIKRPSFLLLLTDMSKDNVNVMSECSLTESKLKTLIGSHSQLCEAVQMANLFFRSQLLASISCSFFDNISALYFLMGTNIDSFKDFQHIKPFLLQSTWVFAHTAHLITLFWASKPLVDAINVTAPTVCRLITCETNSQNIKKQLETFLFQLMHNKVRFSALGLFEIEAFMLVSVASSVTTYLVILLQSKH